MSVNPKRWGQALQTRNCFSARTATLLGVHQQAHADDDGAPRSTARAMPQVYAPTRRHLGRSGGLICGENSNSLAPVSVCWRNRNAFTWRRGRPLPLASVCSTPSTSRAKYHAYAGRVSSSALRNSGRRVSRRHRTLNAESNGRSFNCRWRSFGHPRPGRKTMIVGPVDDAPQIVYADADFERINRKKAQLRLRSPATTYNRFLHIRRCRCAFHE